MKYTAYNEGIATAVCNGFAMTGKKGKTRIYNVYIRNSSLFILRYSFNERIATLSYARSE